MHVFLTEASEVVNACQPGDLYVLVGLVKRTTSANLVLMLQAINITLGQTYTPCAVGQSPTASLPCELVSQQVAVLHGVCLQSLSANPYACRPGAPLPGT
jgi:hypothetical protein